MRVTLKHRARMYDRNAVGSMHPTPFLPPPPPPVAFSASLPGLRDEVGAFVVVGVVFPRAPHYGPVQDVVGASVAAFAFSWREGGGRRSLGLKTCLRLRSRRRYGPKKGL